MLMVVFFFFEWYQYINNNKKDRDLQVPSHSGNLKTLMKYFVGINKIILLV
jgi:hypothetical protein